MFTLNFNCPIEDVSELKIILKNKFPDIKSSHLTEAIARGLGFNSHAGLLHQANLHGKVVIVSNGRAFCEFLEPRHCAVTGASFYVAVAQIAIRIILRDNQKIGLDGYGCGRPKRRPDGKWENARELYARFLAERSELDTGHSALGFLRSLTLLQLVPTIKTISTKIGSYGIKHIAEKLTCSFPTGEELGPAYVSNAELILAAFHLGLRFRTEIDHLGYDSPNLWFNLSARSLTDLDCAIRPDGARAQDRRRKLERDQLSKYIFR